MMIVIPTRIASSFSRTFLYRCTAKGIFSAPRTVSFFATVPQNRRRYTQKSIDAISFVTNGGTNVESTFYIFVARAIYIAFATHSLE
jgi:hypothetical protein